MCRILLLPSRPEIRRLEGEHPRGAVRAQGELHLERPGAGIDVEDRPPRRVQLHWVTFFSNRVLRANASGRVFETATLPGGQIDGIVSVRGSWYVTSWADEAVYRTSLGGGPADPVVTGFPFPADLGYDATRRRLLIPSLFGNVILIHTLED